MQAFNIIMLPFQAVADYDGHSLWHICHGSLSWIVHVLSFFADQLHTVEITHTLYWGCKRLQYWVSYQLSSHFITLFPRISKHIITSPAHVKSVNYLPCSHPDRIPHFLPKSNSTPSLLQMAFQNTTYPVISSQNAPSTANVKSVCNFACHSPVRNLLSDNVHSECCLSWPFSVRIFLLLLIIVQYTTSPANVQSEYYLSSPLPVQIPTLCPFLVRAPFLHTLLLSEYKSCQCPVSTQSLLPMSFKNTTRSVQLPSE